MIKLFIEEEERVRRILQIKKLKDYNDNAIWHQLILVYECLH